MSGNNDSFLSPGPAAEEAEAFRVSDAEAVTPDQLINEFWESEPLGVWKQKADETIAALDVSVDVVTLSGRNGTGKTMQFGRLLERAYPDEPFGNDASMVNSESDNYLRYSNRMLIIDEMTEAAHDGYTRQLLGHLVGRRQLVLIFPAPTVDIRRGAVAQVVEDIQAISPEATVRDLGDVPTVRLDKEKALGLLATLALPTDLIRAVDKVPALLNPRLFGILLDLRSVMDAESWNTVEEIKKFLEGSHTRKRSVDLAENLYVGLCGWDGYRPHGPFLSNSLSTAEAIELYEFAGVPLPDPSVFDVEKLGFDPYAKS